MNKIKQKIKIGLESKTTKDILISLIVILVGFGSYGLGRLSKDNLNAGIKIEYPENQSIIETSSDTNSAQNDDSKTTIDMPKTTEEETSNMKITKDSINSTNSLGKTFFASKVGQKYYSIGCSGGKSIKQENRIYFNTETEAQAAGYEKSSTCK